MRITEHHGNFNFRVRESIWRFCSLAIALALCFTPIAASAEDKLPSVLYKKHLTDSQQIQFQSSLEETWRLLPLKVRAELPSGLEIVVDDLNHEKPGQDSIEGKAFDCDIKNKTSYLHFGKFNWIKKRLTIDYQMALKLATNDHAQSACGHGTWYQTSQATILHEAIHAWDDRVATSQSGFARRENCMREQSGKKYPVPVSEECRNVLQRHHQLSDDPEFLKLTGWYKFLFWYEQKNSRPQRSADAYEFKSPQESLAVNLEYFLLDPDYQCRRPSLYHYFVKVFEQQPIGIVKDASPKSCDNVLIENYAEFLVLKKIDTSRVYRIDYLLAAAGDDLASNFGHSMFRVVMCAPEHYSSAIKAVIPATPMGPECLNDEAYHLVVSFRANVDDVVLSYWKGMVGGYTSRPYVLPYLQVKEEYTSDQLRDITLYPLRLSDKDRNAWLANILELVWTYGGDYKFLTNNCAVESLLTLQATLPASTLNQYSPLSPRGVLSALEKSGLVQEQDDGIEVIKSKKAELEGLYLVAFPGDSVENTANYLRHTLPLERAARFPVDENRSVQRVAALRRLEEQIKRMQTRELTILARQSLYETMRENIQGLLLPEMSKVLTLYGYGIPYQDEISLDESAQMQQVKDMRQQIIEWLKKYQAARWQEMLDVDHNLDALDILAVRKLEKQGFQ